MTQLQQSVEFLRCVLPAEGYYVAVIFDRPEGPPRQAVCSTIEQLAETLLAGDSAGRTVYHACASFRDPNVRKVRGHENALAARSLWADLDCGPGKPYADQEAGWRATVDFCRAAGLPVPLFVSSGRGLHLYWPLTESLPPDTWRQYAARLKALCVEHGLKIDPARTGDISSILRTPGTHWRKDGEREVRWDGRIEQFSPARLGGNSEPNQLLPRTSAAPRTSILSRILSGSSYQAAYADPIADGCAQVRRLRTSGQMPEPDWYACLGVLAFCEDGDARAHEWSARDFAGYSGQQTSDRLVRSKTLSGATLCSRFEYLNSGGCDGCQHRGKINSPVSLGFAQADIRTPRDSGPELCDPVAAGSLPQVALPTLKDPFYWRGNELAFKTEDQNGVHVWTTITSQPVFLDSVQTGEIDGSNYSYKFKKLLPHDGWSEIVVDARELHGASGIATMFGKGVVVHDPKLFLKFVRQQVDEYHAAESLQTRYDQFGWKTNETAFLFGKYLYTAAGPVEAIGAKEVTTRCQWLGPTEKGSLLAWTDAADQLFARDMEAVSAVVLSGFAAILMRLQSTDEGGAIIHLHTQESGQGKTTALMGAWTAWGLKNGLSLTNEDTAVAKPITLGVLGNLPVIYDELRNKDPEVIKRMVVMFTEGRDRMRGMTDATIRHTKANWQTVMLSAANASLIDQLSGDGTDAPAYRVLELHTRLPKDVDKAQGERLKRVLNDNAGHAGDAFLRYLVQPDTMAWTREALLSWTDEIWKRTRLGSEHRFRVRLVGAIAVAAALVNKLEILHFQTERIMDYLMNELGAEENQSQVSSSPPLERSINAFGEFINDHYNEIVVLPRKFQPHVKQHPLIRPQHRLTIRYEIEPQRVYIQWSVFRDWCLKRQLSPRMMVKLMKQNGALIEDKRQITLSAGTDIPGASVVCMVANAAHPALSGVVTSVEQVQQTG